MKWGEVGEGDGAQVTRSRIGIISFWRLDGGVARFCVIDSFFLGIFFIYDIRS